MEQVQSFNGEEVQVTVNVGENGVVRVYKQAEEGLGRKTLIGTFSGPVLLFAGGAIKSTMWFEPLPDAGYEDADPRFPEKFYFEAGSHEVNVKFRKIIVSVDPGDRDPTQTVPLQILAIVKSIEAKLDLM